jgi:hypothetical protein
MVALVPTFGGWERRTKGRNDPLFVGPSGIPEMPLEKISVVPIPRRFTEEIRVLRFTGFVFSFDPVHPVIPSKRPLRVPEPLSARGWQPVLPEKIAQEAAQ